LNAKIRVGIGAGLLGAVVTAKTKARKRSRSPASVTVSSDDRVDMISKLGVLTTVHSARWIGDKQGVARGNGRKRRR
jgi:divalent metal cation (Fe/Co/Zn/Cd) transporter